MSAESTPPKYAIVDDVEVPEKVIENGQVIVDRLSQTAKIPAALIMPVHHHEIEVFVSSRSAGNVYQPGEITSLDSGLYCETVMPIFYVQAS